MTYHASALRWSGRPRDLSSMRACARWNRFHRFRRKGQNVFLYWPLSDVAIRNRVFPLRGGVPCCSAVQAHNHFIISLIPYCIKAFKFRSSCNIDFDTHFQLIRICMRRYLLLQNCLKNEVWDSILSKFLKWIPTHPRWHKSVTDHFLDPQKTLFDYLTHPKWISESFSNLKISSSKWFLRCILCIASQA